LTAKAFLVNHVIALSNIYDVFLVANFENSDLSIFSDLPVSGVKHITISRNVSLIKDIAALLALRNYFKEMRFDVVHSVTPKAGLLASLAARLGNISYRIHVFTGQVWHTKMGLYKRFLMFLDRFIVWNSTHILVDGESQRQFLIANNIVKAPNTVVLGKGSISGVDTKRFVPDAQLKDKIRNELGIKTDEIVYMFLGRMNKDKGIIDLAEAFNRLQLNKPDIRLLFVGYDEENIKHRVQQIVKNYESVIFYGPTPYPEKLLQASDVFCLPSYREGFGTSVIEASLLEKPIICSDTYGLMETIIENKTGLRHKVADIDSLYTEMEKLAEDKKLRERLGIGGRAYVLKNFSSQTITEKWLAFYKEKIHV
jgi:glycosyltransferase involved in cell wall biosynthesis